LVLAGCGQRENRPAPTSSHREGNTFAKVISHYDQSSAFSCQATVKVSRPSQPEELYDFEIALQKPNLLRVDLIGGDGEGRFWVCDGKNLTELDSEANRYRVQPAPETINPDQVFGIFPFILSQLLMSGDGPKSLLQDLSKARKVGEETEQGVPCVVYRAGEGSGSQLTVWVSKEHLYFVRADLRIVQQGKATEISETYREVVFEPQFDKDTFVFAPPSGAKEIVGEGGR